MVQSAMLDGLLTQLYGDCPAVQLNPAVTVLALSIETEHVKFAPHEAAATPQPLNVLGGVGEAFKVTVVPLGYGLIQSTPQLITGLGGKVEETVPVPVLITVRL